MKSRCILLAVVLFSSPAFSKIWSYTFDGLRGTPLNLPSQFKAFQKHRGTVALAVYSKVLNSKPPTSLVGQQLDTDTIKYIYDNKVDFRSESKCKPEYFCLKASKATDAGILDPIPETLEFTVAYRVRQEGEKVVIDIHADQYNGMLQEAHMTYEFTPIPKTNQTSLRVSKAYLIDPNQSFASRVAAGIIEVEKADAAGELNRFAQVAANLQTKTTTQAMAAVSEAGTAKQ